MQENAKVLWGNVNIFASKKLKFYENANIFASKKQKFYENANIFASKKQKFYENANIFARERKSFPRERKTCKKKKILPTQIFSTTMSLKGPGFSITIYI